MYQLDEKRKNKKGHNGKKHDCASKVKCKATIK